MDFVSTGRTANTANHLTQLHDHQSVAIPSKSGNYLAGSTLNGKIVSEYLLP
jgi:hypothetical protein